jgi:hypothetical protein
MRQVAIVSAILFAVGLCPAHSQAAEISSARFAWLMAQLIESEDACFTDVTDDLDALSRFMSRNGLTFDDVYQRDLPRFRDRVVKMNASIAGSAICSNAIKDFGPRGDEIPGLLFWK